MFGSLIAEARSLVGKRKPQKKEIEERPELSTGDGLSFPKRGTEGQKTRQGLRPVDGHAAGARSGYPSGMTIA